MGFAWNGSGNAAGDRSSVLALRERRVAGRLAFPASSLALSRARLAPANDGPSRSSTARRRSTSIAASGSSTHSSAPLRSPCLLPGPAHAGLLSWGRTSARFAPDTWPHRPSVGFAPSCEGPSARPLPAMGKPITFGLRMPSGSPVPTSWFLTTSPGFSAQRRAGLLHPAADPGVRRVSHGPAEAGRDPRDATTPRRIIPTARSAPVTRSPGPPGVRPRAEPRWNVIADATRATRDEVGTFEALSARMVCDVRAPCGAENALSFLGFCLLFEVPPTAWPRPPPRRRGRERDAPTVVTPRNRRTAKSTGEVPLPTVQNRRTGSVTSMRFGTSKNAPRSIPSVGPGAQIGRAHV